MSLPIVELPTRKVALSDGQVLVVRALSRATVIRLKSEFTAPERAAAAEVLILSKATGTTEEDAAAWLDSVLTEDAETVFDAIRDISALPKAGDPDPQP